MKSELEFKLDRLTKSMINSYLSCPRKMYYQYIERVPEKPNIGRDIGKSFHDITHKFYKDLLNYLTEFHIPKEDAPKHFSALIGKIVKNTKLPIGSELLDNFITYEKDRWDICASNNKIADCFFPLYSELHLRSDKLRLGGIIDRIFKDLDDSLILFEIKTGSMPKSKAGWNSLTRELGVYYLLCETREIEISRWGCYFPKVNEAWTEEVSKRTLVRVGKDINKVRKGIDGKIFTRAMDSGYSFGLCRYCSYSTKCLFQ